MKSFVKLLSGALMLASAVAMAQPAIRASNGVLNASSYATGIARGSWFVVFGTGLGPAELSIYPSPPPFPETWARTTVTFEADRNGPKLNCRIWYTSDTQVAALLPSNAAPGDYNVVVTYGGVASAPYKVTVVERNFGFATQTATGAGPAQATYADYALNRFYTGAAGNWAIRPAQPGETMTLWGTGLGADAQSDLNGGTSGDMTASAQVKVAVGGIEVTPMYAGRSPGNPGLDQINIKVPANVSPSCFASLQVRVGGKSSNIGTVAVAAKGDQACTNIFLTPTQLLVLSSGGRLVLGNLNISKLGGSPPAIETATGSFSSYGVDQIASTNIALLQPGACSAFRRTGDQAQILAAVPPFPMDAGTTLLLSGPNLSKKAVPRLPSRTYGVTLFSSGTGGTGGTGSPALAAGTYNIEGPTGFEILGFNATVDFEGDFSPNMGSITSPIARDQNLAVSWTGGGSTAVVMTGISAARLAGTGPDTIYDAIGFVCVAPAAAGHFTIPSSVLSQLPPASGEAAAGSLGLFTVSATRATTFVARLTGSGMEIDQSMFMSANGMTKSVGWR